MPQRIHGGTGRLEWRMNKATFEELAKQYGIETVDYTGSTLLGIPVKVTDTDQVNLVLRVD